MKTNPVAQWLVFFALALAVVLLCVRASGPSAAEKAALEESHEQDAELQCLKLEMTGEADFGTGAVSRERELACRQLIQLRRQQR